MGDSRSQLLFPALILLGLRPGEIIPDKNTQTYQAPFGVGALILWGPRIVPQFYPPSAFPLAWH